MDIDKQDQSISLYIFTSSPTCTECGVLDCQFEVGLFDVPYVFCPSLSLVLPWHQYTSCSHRWEGCCWVSACCVLSSMAGNGAAAAGGSFGVECLLAFAEPPGHSSIISRLRDTWLS